MDLYLKMVTNRDVMVKGGSKDAGHVDWMEVLTFDWVDDGGGVTFSRHNAIRVTVPETSADLAIAGANGADFPTVILDVPARREWFLFREAYIRDLRFAGDDRFRTNTISLYFKSVEAHHGAYAQAAGAAAAAAAAGGAAQAAKAATSVGLAKLRKFLTK
jgi:hypothetical protein